MRYWLCLSCKRKTTTLLHEQLLKCPCGEYAEHLLVEVDSKGKLIHKEVNDGIN